MKSTSFSEVIKLFKIICGLKLLLLSAERRSRNRHHGADG